ncbi:MAG TPA: TonB-dependent receptor [Woeseiaceae bacterium]|nr:TonB-dependent receptor [Woeseiaceae bacterium]
MSIRSLILAAAVPLLTLGLVPHAAAQSDGPIDEIIVTAQKREQSVQDIGISIATFTGEDLRELGADQAEDLYQFVSNMSLQNVGGAGVPIVIIRGIGLQNFRINDSPTTAFYVDDVYQPSVASAEWTMFDVNRVEILKGPQGGLYGRNALGGAIQIISNTPEIGAANNGYMQLGIAEYAQTDLEGAAEFGLSDSLSMRVAGRYVQSSDGLYRDVTSGERRGDEDRFAARALLRYAPNDTTDMLFKLHGGYDDSDMPPLRPMGFYADIGTADAFGLPGVSLGFLNGALGLGLGDPLCASVRNGQGMDPATCADISGGKQQDYGIVGDVHTSPSGFPSFQENSWNGASANLRFDLSEDYSLQSITSYDQIDYRRYVDMDGTPREHQHIDYNTKIDALSQEFRLFYDSSDTVSWVAGLSYAKEDLDEASVLYGAQGVLPAFFGGATFNPQSYEQETTALAVYGHGEWMVSDTVTLIGELRYTDAEKTFAGGSVLGFADGSTAPFVSTDDKASFTAPSGKVGVEWTPHDNVLWFANIARGFKTGGFYGGFATSVEQLEPFNEETVIAYDAGFKSDLADGRVRLNGSVFFYDRKDVQQNAADPSSPVAIKQIVNIGDVEAMGAELDVTWIPTDELTFMVGIGTTDSEVKKSNYVQSSSLPLLPDASLLGTNTPNYSDLTANFVARWDKPVTSGLDMFLQADGRYQSDMDLSIITHEIEKAIFREPGYALFNLRAGLGPDDGQWQLMGYVENVADKEYRTTVGNDGTFGIYELYGKPRTWGLRYIYRWD